MILLLIYPNCGGFALYSYILCGVKFLCYTLSFTEIHECNEGLHLCEHSCINTAGSYTCACNTGYTLASNGFSCTSKSVYIIQLYF